MTRPILLILAICGSLYTAAYAQGNFPFMGEVTGEDVNVRAGQNTNFEKLAVLKKGEPIVVVEKSYTWYKIRLPAKAKCYISKDYLEMFDKKTWVVTGSRVNLRAAPSTNATSIGQLAQDSIVKVISQSGEWYQIEPMDGTYGWIAEQFVTHRSDEVPELSPVIKLARVEEEPPEFVPEAPEEIPQKEEAAADVSFSSAGTIEALEADPSDRIQYKFILNDNDVYYLQAPAYVLNQFLHFKAEIKGTLNNDPTLFRPVVIVSKVHLLL